jgi:hypothetical protein
MKHYKELQIWAYMHVASGIWINDLNYESYHTLRALQRNLAGIFYFCKGKSAGICANLVTC